MWPRQKIPFLAKLPSIKSREGIVESFLFFCLRSELLSASQCSPVLLGSPLVSSVLPGSPRCSPCCAPQFSSVLPGSPRFSSVLPGSAWFFSVLLSSPRFCLVLLSSARFSSVLLGSPLVLRLRGPRRCPSRCSRSKICKKQLSRIWCLFCKFGVVPQDFDDVFKQYQNIFSCYWVKVF